MLSKNNIKHISSLKISKFRKESGLFIAEGTKVVEELMESTIPIRAVYATPAWLSKFPNFPFANKAEVVRDTDMERISQMTTPPGILAVAETPHHTFDPERLKGSLGLVLDGINDPGNLGTIIRTAEWFGVGDIYCSPDTVEAFHPKVVQAAMGSLFRMRITVLPPESLLSVAKAHNINIYGAVMDGDDIYKTNLRQASSLLIIGSESHGIRNNIKPYIAFPITIPAIVTEQSPQNPESLNASIATALALSAFVRGGI